MAPKIVTKLFKRKPKENCPYFRPKCVSPNAIGISDSTCEVNGDPFNGWKLPIPPPEQRVLKLGARQCNRQQASHFFQLPIEVRKLIYIELMGNRRVHIEYAWMLPSPFRPKLKRDRERWDWWHGVCQRSGSYVDDRCWDRRDERYVNMSEGLQSAPAGTKLGGVEWLRCCQIGYAEALTVLYGTNVFALRTGLDTPFIMSRLLSPVCSSLIMSMEISFDCWYKLDETPQAMAWETVYPALFGLFEDCFSKVHKLRLTMHMPAWEKVRGIINDGKIDQIIAPWERLAQSRDWTSLQLCVPLDWLPCLTDRVEKQTRWELTMIDWYERTPVIEDL
ncbi:hypothetical protein N7491_001037 [Penicillium cf. griseofulvum]|uniref:DUF7730 domain-containing protein n=1 Tax=Penicillium cf. griseofulvum TaxID=2972120 RepID=A0A9W9M8G3_9EURO|nr:hypothetical protein N7472_006172 [Penicillium cf. griseofulvum]KAJ5444955.1 hypothetical protein N7491_001037 [Penicillium cf. griseofulvum]